MSNSAIPLGERDGHMFRAYEVENGLRCGCVCPGCRGALVAANQGEKRFPYFRHAELEGCSNGRAEGVRRAAVQLIAQRKHLLLPALSDTATVFSQSGRCLVQDFEVEPSRVVPDQVERFVDLGDLRAHARLTLQGRQLVVRIKCSSREEHERKRRLREMDLSSIEIDLHRLTDADINDQTIFARAVLDDPGNRVWIRSLRGERLKQHAVESLQPEIDRLNADWAQAEKVRLQTERERAAQHDAEMQAQAAVRAAHREMQESLAREQHRGAPDAASARQQREDLIVATMFKAVREWGGLGAECSACRLVSPPSSQLCLYCASDNSQLKERRYSADLETTIGQIKRVWTLPDESLMWAAHLIVLPDLGYEPSLKQK